MKSCNCKSGASNTGVPFCVDIYNRTKQIIFQSIFDSTGVRNSIKDSDFVGGVLPKAYIDSMINHVDPSKRWFVLPEVKNVTWTQADPNTEDIDGIPFVVSEGNITGSADLVGQNASDKYYGILESFKCGKYGMIPVTVAGELVGVEGTDELFPQPLEQGTFWLSKAIKTKSTVNKITMNFMYQEDFPIGDINYIQSDSIESGSLDSLNGLQDIVLEERVGSTTSSLLIKAELCYGGFNNKLPVEGLVSDDFSTDDGVTIGEVYNESTPASVTIASVTESSVDGEEGYYEVVIPIQGSGEVIKVDIFKTGYDAQSITITLP